MTPSADSPSKKSNCKPKRAAGFFLYRRPATAGGRLLYLVLWNAKTDEAGFPKGHRDDGESDLETARRETDEETGIADVRAGRWFEWRMSYPVKDRRKDVVYFVGETTASEVRLSREHSRGAWLDYDDVCAALTHESLRDAFHAGASYLKDTALRRGLGPDDARAMLVEHAGADAPVVGHTTEVAAVARALADASPGVDAGYVEACAWLHDIGRARTHDHLHPLEGFRIVAGAGYPGYAPPCLSHYTKGREPESMGIEAELAEAMNRACDLTTFPYEEQLVALADALAAGTRRVTLEERRDELVRRYGTVEFFEAGYRAAREIRAAFEHRSGRDLYRLLGL